MTHFPRRQNFKFDNTFPIETDRSNVCTHVHSRLSLGKLAIFTNVVVLTCNVNIVDLLPVIDSLICFSSFGSLPIQGILNIYSRVLHICVRAKFIFKDTVFEQQFSKLKPPNRNNHITRDFDFLKPRICLMIPVLKTFLFRINWFVSIVHAKTPMLKAP